MSSEDPGPQPDPETTTPPPGPGGPADEIQLDPDDFPLETPDQPRSAQVEEEEVPDEIDQSEDVDEDDEGQAKPNTEEPSG